MADHLLERGDAAGARSAGAAARAVAAGRPASSIPFARLLVEKAFARTGPAPDEGAGEERPSSPLILAPR
jgi:hypothetical protein